MSGEVLKADKDFSKEVDKLIPEAQKLGKSNPQQAVDKLLVLEKQTRQASDLPSTSRILTAIVTICKDAGDWKLLDEQVVALSKKHGQLKQASTKMVQVVMSFLEEMSDLDRKLATIETLRTVTEGKIFVEVERARVTRILSEIKQTQGDTKAAKDILCELQVETFGSMSRREKTEFILDQIQLCIDSDDWTQAAILGRKISTKYFARKPKRTPEEEEEDRKEREEKEKKRSVDEAPPEPEDDVTDLKLRYYEQQIALAKQEGKYLEVCKNYRQVLDTQMVEDDPAKLQATLQRVCWYILLAPYDNEQSDLLHRIKADSRYSELPREQQLLRLFTTPEIMHWPNLAPNYAPYLGESDVFDVKETAATKKTKAHERWEDLRKRVIEHNVRVVAKYYTRIRMPRLCELLNLSEDETEKYISDLVTAKTIFAKIDRPARIISFAKPRDADDVLNEWSGNMKSLLGLLERIDHLITKEEMMARIQPKGQKAKPSTEYSAAYRA